MHLGVKTFFKEIKLDNKELFDKFVEYLRNSTYRENKGPSKCTAKEIQKSVAQMDPVLCPQTTKIAS